MIIRENYLRLSYLEKLHNYKSYEKLLLEIFSLELVPTMIALKDLVTGESSSWIEQRNEEIGGCGYQWIQGFNDGPSLNLEEHKETFEEFDERVMLLPTELS